MHLSEPNLKTYENHTQIIPKVIAGNTDPYAFDLNPA